MSVYQYVFFAAVDKPLSDEQLAYMERQSTRADIGRWQFENEYHYGDFRGDAIEMMRRGYDVHLHYASYGIRKIMLRLPQGLPVDSASFMQYELEYAIEWIQDSKGPGGVLTIQPEADAGDYHQGFFEFDQITETLPRVREMLVEGDSRLLYLAWLACNWDDDASEPPVPAGLEELPSELENLVDFYELSSDLVKAAAKDSVPAPKSLNVESLIDPWIKKCTANQLRTYLRRVVDGESLRAEILAAIRVEKGEVSWPLVAGKRTYAELQLLAEKTGQARLERERQAKERARKKRIEQIAADPSAAVAEARKLVSVRSTDSYHAAAKILSELREALGPIKGPIRADAAAKQLVKSHPTLNHLKRALKEQGLNYK